mmetsp:Transcript_6807/g.15539  ORF Transcript_6807/g.15539 Transcript_6807/m.15539 type:complete len:219 (+) Transcript_6807:805-1461(+)
MLFVRDSNLDTWNRRPQIHKGCATEAGSSTPLKVIVVGHASTSFSHAEGWLHRLPRNTKLRSLVEEVLTNRYRDLLSSIHPEAATRKIVCLSSSIIPPESIGNQFESEIGRPCLSCTVLCHQPKPPERFCNNPRDFSLDLQTAMVDVGAVHGQYGHDVVKREKTYIDVIWTNIAKLSFSLYMRHNTAVRDLDTLWDARGTRTELAKCDIFGPHNWESC